MRTKTPAFRRRPRNSISPSNAQLIYPLHYQDEDNEEYHLHGSDNGESEDAGFSKDNDKNNDDVEGKDDAFDDDAEKEGDDDLVPDDVNEKDEDANYVVPDCVEGVGESAGVKCILADWLGVFSYISSGGSSPVLVCSENDCPIAMQEARMSTEPDFDDTGKFYCPYCWYKRVVARTEELRKEALLAKRELLNFIHSKRDDGNGEKQEDEASNMKAASLSTSRKENSGDCGNGLNDDVNETIYYNQGQVMCIVSKGKEKSVDESTSKAHGADNVADGQIMQEEDIENSENDASVLEANQGKNGMDGLVRSNTIGTSTAHMTKDATSKVPAIESFEFVSPDLEAGTVVRQMRIKHTAKRALPWQVDPPRIPSFQPGSSANDKMKNLQGKATTAKNAFQCQELNKQIMNPILGSGKRKPLPWTTEEVDTLKEGVRRFSLTSNKNIPWRKILEFGHHVFDNNRIPVDLKDKWKKIMAKEDPKSNKGTLFPFEE